MGDVMNCLQDVTKRLRKIEDRRSRSPVRKRHQRVVSSFSSSSQSSETSLSSRSKTPPGSSIMDRSGGHASNCMVSPICLPSAGQGDAPPPGVELSEDVVEIMGTPDTNTFIYGPNLHKDLVSRWQKAVVAGLSEEDKKELCNKYPTPENFQYMAARKHNPMVVKAISSSNLQRDTRLMALQGQTAACLASTDQLFTLMLAEGGGATENTSNCSTMQAD
ncbi:unnamed protein product [Acanthoscelides obtectus]|uniref:Uncharacterized protein n=1 Tax=Acanthoscelides obtectus TaxID=200917 RepID=A0A9P0JWY6_ACAOB|nr:unnamed protein product [Acanthoscelides obtectus]CAK1632015.1 hypothetical protein AOBTE_LOCUS7309 [Acanthoscelides obtectus]